MRIRAAAYRSGLLPIERVAVPVVVVGNLYVGGTGKTPLVIALVRAMLVKGLQVGVVARGYRGSAREARLLAAQDAPDEVGDEPLLIVRATRVPLAVGADRAAAARTLLAASPSCRLIVADDGLQHLRLARDFEIALVDERGLGNGWVLPAGPLREPADRLASVDAIALHGDAVAPAGAAPRFSLRTRLGDRLHRLGAPAETLSLAELIARQRDSSVPVTAAAGIGVPERFFRMLRDRGLAIEPLPLPDHYDFRVNPFADVRSPFVLITEKDAVKCERIAALRDDPRIWVVSLEATVDAELVELIITHLNLRGRSDGPPAA